MKNKNVLSIIALISSSLLGCSSVSDSGYSINEFDDIPGLLKYYNVPGVSIAIIKDFKIDKLLVYGVKNQSTREPVTQDTLFQAGSISKSVSAIAAMKLSQNGLIDLDEDINNKLVSWTVEENEYTAEEKVTLRRLLSHRAGISIEGFSEAGYYQNEELPSLVEILNGQPPAYSPAVVLDNTPGSAFKYSNEGYLIMQQALIDMTQQPFENIMDETVLEPLDMTSSSFDLFLSEDRIARASAGHDTEGQNILGDYKILPEFAPAGLWTTPEDLAKFLIELQLSLLNQSNTVLAAEVVEEVLTPIGGPVNDEEVNDENYVREFYGLGFRLKEHGDDYKFGHGGATIGFRTRMAAHTRSGAGYVVMTNSLNGVPVYEEIISFIEKAETQDTSQYQINHQLPR